MAGMYLLGLLLLTMSVNTYGVIMTQDFPSTEPVCLLGNASTCQDIGPGIEDSVGTVFQSLRFHCNGVLVRWTLCSKTPGHLYLSVWSVTAGGGHLALKGFNEIWVDTSGCQVFEIPFAHQISVRESDMVGVFYRQPYYPASLCWSNSNTPSTTFQILHHWAEDLPQGATIPISSLGEAHGMFIPSIEALVKGASGFLRLMPESGYRQGRAEIKLKGIWGTICDRWFHVNGWPSKFCYQLGFPGSQGACYTWEMGPEYEAEVETPIWLHSPNLCKASIDKAMHDCPNHPHGRCNHDMDMHITCNAKVRCSEEKSWEEKGCRITSCLAQNYQDGFWGSICDSKDLVWHMDNPHLSWTTAFCSELNLGEPNGVQWASTWLKRYVPKNAVLLQNPVCDVTPPANLDQCLRSEGSCGHQNDIIVICIKC